MGTSLDLESGALSPLSVVEKTGEALLLDQGSNEELLLELEEQLRRSLTEDPVFSPSSTGEAFSPRSTGDAMQSLLSLDEVDEFDPYALTVATALCCAIKDEREKETVGLVLALNKQLDFGALTTLQEAPAMTKSATSAEEPSADQKDSPRESISAQRRMSDGRMLDQNQVKVLALGSLLDQANRAGSKQPEQPQQSLPHNADKEEFCAFEASDLGRLNVLLSLAGHVVKMASLFDKETRANKKVSVLLTLIRNVQLAIEAKDLSRVMQLISVHALSMFECDRCTFYIVDNFANELIGHFVAPDPDEREERLQEIRVPMEGIAGSVAKTGSVLNIRDAWSDNRFWKQNDLKTGYRTRTILCAPLISSNGKVVAVIQCINKHNFECFNDDDEKILTQISILLSDLMQKLLLESSYTAFIQTSSAIAADVKHMYRQFCHEHDHSPLSNRRRNSREKPLRRTSTNNVIGARFPASIDSEQQMESICESIYRWDFDYLSMSEDVDRITPCLEQCFAFEHIKLLPSFSVPMDSFRSFVVELRSMYRTDAAYHNWMHAFITVHATFLMLNSLALIRLLPSIDVFALLLAALGHDVEHPGFTNAYQVATESPLALLYNDKSVLEQHHAATLSRLLKSSDASLLRTFDAASVRRIRQDYHVLHPCH